MRKIKFVHRQYNKKSTDAGLKSDSQSDPQSSLHSPSQIKSWVAHHRTLVTVGVVMIAVLAALQVSLSAKVATRGREIAQLEQERSELKLGIGIARKQVADLGSIAVVEKRATNIGMVKVSSGGSVVFLKIPIGQQLAKK